MYVRALINGKDLGTQVLRRVKIALRVHCSKSYPKTRTNADLMAANNLGKIRVKKRTGGKKRKKGNLRIDVVRRVDVAVWVHCRETTRHAQMYTHPGPVCVCDTFVIDNMSFVHTQMYESSHTHASFIHIVIRHSQ